MNRSNSSKIKVDFEWIEMVRVIADYNPGAEDAGQGVLELKAGGKSLKREAKRETCRKNRHKWWHNFQSEK